MESGFHWLAEGRYREAERVYRQAAQKSPDEIVLYELGVLYLLQKKYPEAEDALQKALAISPQNAIVQYELFKACMLQKKHQKARRLLGKLLSVFPDNSALRLYLQRFDSSLGKGEVLPSNLVRLSTSEYQLSPYDSDVTMADSGAHGIPQEDATMADPGAVGSSDATMAESDFASDATLPDVVSEDATLAESNFASDVTLLQGDSSDATIADPELTSSATPRSPGRQTTEDNRAIAKRKTESYRRRDSEQEKEEEIVLGEAIFDDYLHKERLLGQGGMGEVYLVRHLKWDKLVAIKRCTHTEKPVLLERFKRECVAWLTMEKHPNVVSAVHYTYWENKPALLIEYIEGQTLRNIIHSLRITSMVERILAKLGTRPPLDKAMSLLTFFGGPQERKEIAQAWMTIIKEHSLLSIDEVVNILRQVRVFSAFDIEFLKSLWPTLPSVHNLLRLNILELLDFAIQICWGMAHAHRHALLHRDLKPANIIVEREEHGNGVAKITDFGLVKLKGAADTNSSQTGEIYRNAGRDASSSTALGTPRYMPLEQWESPELVSERSDIYSFGIVLYELLSFGRSPFKSHVEDHIKVGDWWMNITPQNEFYYWSTRHCSQQPLPLGEFSKGVPPEVEKIVMQCLEKDFEKRPPGFSWMADKLLHIYQRVANREFPRKQNISPELLAIELNNRAVSLFEMEYPQKSRQFLERAIKTAPNLLEIRLNQTLFDFLSGAISTREMVSKVTSNFSSIEKDLQVFEVIISIYLNYGVCYKIVHPNLDRVVDDDPKNLSMKRLLGKSLFLRGCYGEAEKIFYALCAGEKSRIEDWYHFIASLYHQSKFDEIQTCMNRAVPHFKFHPCYREIKKILADPPKTEKEDNWRQIDIWESSYALDKKIDFIHITPDDRHLIICFGNEGKNIVELYDSTSRRTKNLILPFPNRLKKDQLVTLPGSHLAFLSVEGFVHIWNTESGESQKLATQLEKQPKASRGGYLRGGNKYLIACWWLRGEKEKSLITVWQQQQWKKVGQFILPGFIRFATINPQENTCWFASKDVLYTWRIGAELDKKGQKYGYSIRRKQDFLEVVEIRAVYALPGNKLLILRQKSQGENDSLEFYLWDLSGKQQHKSHTIGNLLLQLCSITPDQQRIILLGDHRGKEASSSLYIWNIDEWREENSAQIPLHTRYQKIEVTADNSFIFFDKEEKSFLDMSFDQETPETVEPAGVYDLSTGKEAEIFETEGPIRYFVTASDHRYAFVVTENQAIYVWKNIWQNPFPMYHKLSYLYTKPTSTFQDIGIQKRISRLLSESEKALQQRDAQRAMDYLRGIQNFKGYDWNLVMQRIYRLANHYKWEKIGLRESLKVRRIPWSGRDIVLSCDGKFLFDNAAHKIWDIAAAQEAGPTVFPGIRRKQWFASLDGKFLVADDTNTIEVYDITRKTVHSKFANPGKSFQEALADDNGRLLLLKEEGFGEVVLIDLATSSLHKDISNNKYHAIRDCCAILPSGDKVLFANECQGGFAWTLIQKNGGLWTSSEYNVDFAVVNIPKEPAEGGESSILITNRHCAIFRGINFDFMNDLQFKHVEIFHFQNNSYTTLNEERFRKNWLKSQDIATTDDGVYTFLGLANGSTSVWNTSQQKPMEKWRQVILLHEHKHPIHSLLVTLNNQFLISADTSGQIKIIKIGKLSQDRMWEEGDWEVVDTLKLDDKVLYFQLSKSDRYLFAVCEESIHIWEFDWVWSIEKYEES